MHTRSWKVKEFENAFSRLGKVMDFRQNGRGHRKVMKFHFLVQIFRAVRKLEIFSLSLNINIPQTKKVVLPALVKENINWSWESCWILLPNFWVNLVFADFKIFCFLQKELVRELFFGVLTNNVVSLVSILSCCIDWILWEEKLAADQCNWVRVISTTCN